MIDTHVHFWDINLNIHAWVKTRADPLLMRSFNLDDYIHLQGRVDGLVTIEAADNRHTLQEVAWIAQHIVTNPYSINVKHMAYIDVLQTPDDFRQQLAVFTAYPFVCGFRQIFPLTQVFNSDYLLYFKNNLGLLREKNYVFNAQMKPRQLLQVKDTLIESGVRCVIDHAGLPGMGNEHSQQQWLAMLHAFSGTEVYFKLTHTAPEIVHSVVETLARHQLLIGSNFPVNQQKLTDFPQACIAYNNVNARQLFNF